MARPPYPNSTASSIRTWCWHWDAAQICDWRFITPSSFNPHGGLLTTALISLKGLSLDDVWNNIIVQTGSLDVESGHSMEEQIAVDEARMKIQKESERLESLARQEQQLKKKFELVNKINAIRGEMNSEKK